MTPEAVDPEPNGLPADDNAAFREQTFNIPCTWGKPMVCPNRAGDDFARKAETFEAGERGRDFHPDKIPDAESSNNLAIPAKQLGYKLVKIVENSDVKNSAESMG